MLLGAPFCLCFGEGQLVGSSAVQGCTHLGLPAAGARWWAALASRSLQPALQTVSHVLSSGGVVLPAVEERVGSRAC